MPILNNVTIAWVTCDPDRPKQYKGTGPFKWSVQVITADKKVSEGWTKEFGMKMTPFEKDGKIQYKTTLSTYAFSSSEEVEGKPRKNKPVTVILRNGEAVDPNTVGNDSVANVSFSLAEDKASRRLKGIQLVKMVEYVPNKEDEFELSDDFEIIAAKQENDNDDPF